MKKLRLLAITTSALTLFAACGSENGDDPTDPIAEKEALNAAAYEHMNAAFINVDVAALDTLVSESVVWHNPNPNIEGEGVEFIKNQAAEVSTMSPGWTMETGQMVTEGDWVAGVFHASGTNTGPLMGGTVPATGKSWAASGIDFSRFENGKVVEHYGLFDGMSFRMQLGLMPMDTTMEMPEPTPAWEVAANTTEATDETEAANKATCEAFANAFEANDAETLASLVSDDFMTHDPDPMIPGRGKDHLLAQAAMYTSMSSDMSSTAHHVIADGHWVAVVSTVSGTNDGEMMPGMPPTGKSWSATGIDVMRFDDEGKVVESYSRFDVDKMMMDLGMGPDAGDGDMAEMMDDEEEPVEEMN